MWLEDVANARIHATTKEVPRVRFECEERHSLAPLASHGYASLIVPPVPPTSSTTQRMSVATVTVERRPLSTYAALATEGAP